MKRVHILVIVMFALSAATAPVGTGATGTENGSPDGANSSLIGSRGTPVTSSDVDNASLDTGTTGVAGLVYRATNGSSMRWGRTTGVDFRRTSIAVHDWFNLYNPSDAPVSGQISLDAPDGAEVVRVANESGVALDHEVGGDGVWVNVTLSAGESWLIGVHSNVQGNTLRLRSDRYTHDAAIFLRARGATQDQFNLSGPLEMQGPTGDRNGRDEYVATAEGVGTGESIVVDFEPSLAPLDEEEDRRDGDLYVALGISLVVVVLLALTRTGRLREHEWVRRWAKPGGESIDAFCPRCGTASSGRFCPGCGEEVYGACGECGSELKPGAKFCGKCGTRSR